MPATVQNEMKTTIKCKACSGEITVKLIDGVIDEFSYSDGKVSQLLTFLRGLNCESLLEAKDDLVYALDFVLSQMMSLKQSENSRKQVI